MFIVNKSILFICSIRKHTTVHCYCIKGGEKGGELGELFTLMTSPLSQKQIPPLPGCSYPQWSSGGGGPSVCHTATEDSRSYYSCMRQHSHTHSVACWSMGQGREGETERREREVRGQYYWAVHGMITSGLCHRPPIIEQSCEYHYLVNHKEIVQWPKNLKTTVVHR